MMKGNKKFEELFSDARFLDLSRSESDDAWTKISSRIEGSPAFSFFPLKLQAKQKSMIPLLIAALIFVGGGGTVAASNSAVPGDILFPVDRAAENVRIAFAMNSRAKAELKAKFAEERVEEVEKIISRSSLNATSTATSTASTSPSRKERENGKVTVGLNVAVDFLNKASADIAASGDAEAAARLKAVANKLQTLVSSSTASINTSGHKSRIEVRNEDGRVRIEVKDNGDVKIKTKSSDNDNEDDDDLIQASTSLKIRIGDDDGRQNKGRDDEDDDD